jgi:hypothetical protein
MVYLMTLVIVGVSSTDITVVKCPVAHKRGGASLSPRAFSIISLACLFVTSDFGGAESMKTKELYYGGRLAGG